MPARPIRNPAWYQSKAAFYCLEFVPEILILLLYIPNRVDKRFHIPNGSHRVGDYTARAHPMEKGDGDRRGSSQFQLVHDRQGTYSWSSVPTLTYEASTIELNTHTSEYGDKTPEHGTQTPQLDPSDLERGTQTPDFGAHIHERVTQTPEPDTQTEELESTV